MVLLVRWVLQHTSFQSRAVTYVWVDVVYKVASADNFELDRDPADVSVRGHDPD